MNFDDLLRDDRLRQHKTSQQEIKEMLYLVDRDLRGALIRPSLHDRLRPSSHIGYYSPLLCRL